MSAEKEWEYLNAKKIHNKVDFLFCSVRRYCWKHTDEHQLFRHDTYMFRVAIKA